MVAAWTLSLSPDEEAVEEAADNDAVRDGVGGGCSAPLPTAAELPLANNGMGELGTCVKKTLSPAIFCAKDATIVAFWLVALPVDEASDEDDAFLFNFLDNLLFFLWPATMPCNPSHRQPSTERPCTCGRIPSNGEPA